MSEAMSEARLAEIRDIAEWYGGQVNNKVVLPLLDEIERLRVVLARVTDDSMADRLETALNQRDGYTQSRGDAVLAAIRAVVDGPEES